MTGTPASLAGGAESLSHRERTIIIVGLIPLALRGVRYTPGSASKLLSRNLYIYGLGGILAPFIGITLIDLVIRFLPGM